MSELAKLKTCEGTISILSAKNCETCGKRLSSFTKRSKCVSCLKKKFTDKQFLVLYKTGLNDVEIGKVLNVHPNSARRRRWRMKLPSNFNPKKEVKK